MGNKTINAHSDRDKRLSGQLLGNNLKAYTNEIDTDNNRAFFLRVL